MGNSPHRPKRSQHYVYFNQGTTHSDRIFSKGKPDLCSIRKNRLPITSRLFLLDQGQLSMGAFGGKDPNDKKANASRWKTYHDRKQYRSTQKSSSAL